MQFSQLFSTLCALLFLIEGKIQIHSMACAMVDGKTFRFFFHFNSTLLLAVDKFGGSLAVRFTLCADVELLLVFFLLFCTID